MYQKSRWRNDLRPAILRRDPICSECHRYPSTVADHIKDHRGDLVMFFDPKNCRGVCASCHDHKTGTEHGGNRAPQPPTETKAPEVEAPKTDFDFLAAVTKKS